MMMRKINKHNIATYILVGSIGVLIFNHFIMSLPTGPTIVFDELYYKENAELIFLGKYFYHPIYPPLYSLIISFALYFENWYQGIQVINEILTVILIIPIWLISRMFVGRTTALLAILLTLLLPFQVIYPGYIMSENLFLFLFSFSVYFSLQGANSATWKAGLFGVFLAAGYLTKYLMLPAIPILVAFWIFTPILKGGENYKSLILKRFWINCIVLIVCFVFTMLPWIIYAHHSNISLYNALGLFFTKTGFMTKASNAIYSGERNLINLIMWVGSYTSYIILALAPFLTLLLFYIPIICHLKNSKIEYKSEFLFLLLLILLTFIYCIVSTQHSFRVSYNYPNPSYLLGRYLMHFSPLFIVIGIIAVDRIFRYRDKLKKKNIIYATFLMIFLIFLAMVILFKNALWNFPSRFANIPFNSPDSMFYKTVSIYLVIAFILLLGIFIFSLTITNSKKSEVIFVMIISVVFCWQVMIFNNANSRAQKNISGIHARNIAIVLNKNKYQNIPLYYSVRYLWPSYWESVSLFWGASKINYVAFEGAFPVCDTIDNILFLTEDSLPEQPISSYKFLDGNCYLYKLNPNKINYPITRKKK